jgi:hypothetical protein
MFTVLLDEENAKRRLRRYNELTVQDFFLEQDEDEAQVDWTVTDLDLDRVHPKSHMPSTRNRRYKSCGPK